MSSQRVRSQVVMRRAHWVPAAIMGALFTATALSAAGAELVRRFPYPFNHMITFASDVDMQMAWHGAAIHRLINERIGLPISDSLWPQGASREASSIFLGGLELNRRPSGVEQHPIYGLLLRQWHRGNIDHFHSWQEDGVPPVSQRLASPIPLASALTVVDIAKSPAMLASLYYQHLRLYFDRPPPDDLFLKLVDDRGRSTMISADKVRRGRAVKRDPGTTPYMTEVLVGVPADVGLALVRSELDLSHLAKIELHSPSCRKGCASALTRIDRDSFSRRSVLLQLPWLEAFNLRPAILTSHGGYSAAQNFGVAGFSQTVVRVPGSIYESPLIPNVLLALGNDPAQHAYHSDLMRDNGLIAVWLWNIDGSSYHYFNLPVPVPFSRSQGIYDLIRTMPPVPDTSSADSFQRTLLAAEPVLKDVDLASIHCPGVLCTGAHGSMLGLNVALGIARINAGLQVEHLWYTHFATNESDFKPTPEIPFRPSAISWLWRLANYHYNFDGQIEPVSRVWVPPAGTVARYRIVYARIARHLRVDATTSRVQIMLWEDPVTGKIIPDPVAGTRDLHGITIYVPDSSKASVVVAGREIRSFTRNPPDATGRASVTLVDDSTPTVLVDETPLAANGSASVSGAQWEDAGTPRADAAAGSKYVTLLASGGDAVLRWQPSQLDLWNITHLQLAYRKNGRGDASVRSRFFVEIEMADGGIVYVAETAAPAPAAGGSGWLIPKSSGGSDWTRQTLSLAELRWPPGTVYEAGKRPPLPLGRVREVRFGLLDATRGERLDLDAVIGLRPNSNGTDADDSKLVGGQVRLADGKPVPSVLVEAVAADGRRIQTLTNQDGYYFFFRQPRNTILKIAALHEKRRCAPARGTLLDVRKNEPEIDISLASCQ